MQNGLDELVLDEKIRSPPYSLVERSASVVISTDYMQPNLYALFKSVF